MWFDIVTSESHISNLARVGRCLTTSLISLLYRVMRPTTISRNLRLPITARSSLLQQTRFPKCPTPKTRRNYSSNSQDRDRSAVGVSSGCRLVPTPQLIVSAPRYSHRQQLRYLSRPAQLFSSTSNTKKTSCKSRKVRRTCALTLPAKLKCMCREGIGNQSIRTSSSRRPIHSDNPGQ